MTAHPLFDIRVVLNGRDADDRGCRGAGGPQDILVDNAGRQLRAPLLEFTDTDRQRGG